MYYTETLSAFLPVVSQQNELLASSFQQSYCQFMAQATSQYGWSDPPVPLETFIQLVQQGLIQGVVSWDETHTTEGLMFWTQGSTPKIDIQAMVLPETRYRSKTAVDALMGGLFTALASSPAQWDIVSFPMTGCQAQGIHSITWYGFKLYGQAKVAFQLMDPVHQAVFAKASEQPCTIAGLDYVPCDSLMSSPQHLITLLAPLLHQCFSAQVDAILEPAFTTIDGCAHILRRLIEGDMGPWLPAQSWILMQHNELRGVSLLTQTAPHGATLQLIGVVPNIQGQGLGLGLLQHTLKQMMFGTEQQAHPLLSLEATHSTDHAASIKLYRKLGFTETGYYPHAILTRETWEKRQLAHPPWYITC